MLLAGARGPGAGAADVRDDARARAVRRQPGAGCCCSPAAASGVVYALVWSVVLGCAFSVIVIAAPGRAGAAARGRAGDDPRAGHVRRPGLARRHRVGAQEIARADGPGLDQSSDRRPAASHAARRRLLRDVSWVLIITGVLLLADAAVTLLWQEPVTAVVAMIKRSRDRPALHLRADRLLARAARRWRRSGASGRGSRSLPRARSGRCGTGDAVGRIEIPRIGLSLLVVQGTDTASLEKGPGHYPSTALPGLRRTVAIAGHRTTYLAPFRHIDALKPGDRISLQMPYGRFVYTVQYHRIVSPYRVVDHPQRRLRPARAVGVQSALQRRPADRRVRPADELPRDPVFTPARSALQYRWGPADDGVVTAGAGRSTFSRCQGISYKLHSLEVPSGATGSTASTRPRSRTR